jgi:hypothetical protein
LWRDSLRRPPVDSFGAPAKPGFGFQALPIAIPGAARLQAFKGLDEGLRRLAA